MMIPALMDMQTLLRAGYLLAASAVSTIFWISPLRNGFLNYGARSKADTKTSNLLDTLAALRVKHSWFTSFYVVSTGSSLFWLSQITTKSPLFLTISQYANPTPTTFGQAALTWLMLFMQGTRRLYECIVLTRPSNAEMWIGHWILGIGFYLVTNVAVWIDSTAALQQHTYTVNDLVLAMPGLRSFIGLALFILASGLQHDCHAYLFSLKEKNQGKYQLPQHPAFMRIVSPHYTAECLIYFSMAIVAAPHDQWLNWTIISALTFVAINLGVTAWETKLFYEEKFGQAAVSSKWVMLPPVY